MDETRSTVNQSDEPKSDPPITGAELAPWSVRVCAKLIDSAVAWVPFTVLWMVGMYFVSQGSHSLGTLFYTIACIEGVIGWGWMIYQTGTTGQSIGKRTMRTKLVGRTGQPIGFLFAFLHETLQIFVDMLPLCIGYLWPLVDKNRQTFSDKILGYHTFRVPRARP